MEKARTIVTFYASGFNTTKTQKHYINPGNYGDDLALYLAAEMEKEGAVLVKEDEFPGQEDFGWFFDFIMDNKRYCLIVGGRIDEADKIEWVAWLERSCGFFASLFGGRNKNIGKEAYELLHRVLSSSDKISKVRWHLKEDFDVGKEDAAGDKPF